MYVHCNRGRSRSGLVVICYLMARNGWAQGDAIQYTRAARKEITLGPYQLPTQTCYCVF